ncbi:hypothetical protein [Flavobacterium sp. W21_SRS_FM6]|uniref:hypothetical protein n=1 Tax=Flavobacterium sp. W21_SRS_FM6 TaxID=3240268 RepID=UPI003F936801
MKKSLIFILLLSLLLSRFSLAQNVLSDTETFAHQDCFSGTLVEYDSWLAMMTKGNKRKAKTPEELEKRLSKFKEMFPRENFDKYKESIECTMTWST